MVDEVETQPAPQTTLSDAELRAFLADIGQRRRAMTTTKEFDHGSDG